jgi:hypothetical protein
MHKVQCHQSADWQILSRYPQHVVDIVKRSEYSHQLFLFGFLGNFIDNRFQHGSMERNAGALSLKNM